MNKNLLALKVTEGIIVAIFTLCILIPLSLIYSLGVGIFSFGSSIINDFDELIKFNKSIWK